MEIDRAMSALCFGMTPVSCISSSSQIIFTGCMLVFQRNESLSLSVLAVPFIQKQGNSLRMSDIFQRTQEGINIKCVKYE